MSEEPTAFARFAQARAASQQLDDHHAALNNIAQGAWLLIFCGLATGVIALFDVRPEVPPTEGIIDGIIMAGLGMALRLSRSRFLAVFVLGAMLLGFGASAVLAIQAGGMPRLAGLLPLIGSAFAARGTFRLAQTEGWVVLWRAIGINCLAYLAYTAALFGLFRVSLPFWMVPLDDETAGAVDLAALGLIAFLMLILVTTQLLPWTRRATYTRRAAPGP